MSFSTVTFSGAATGGSGSQSTTGTFTAQLTGNADGTVSGTWSYSGKYQDVGYYATSGSENISGTLTGAASAGGPWPITLAGAGIINEGMQLSFANGQFTLAVAGGFGVDYSVDLGYGDRINWHDQFDFAAQLSAAGALSGGGTAVFAGARGSYTVSAPQGVLTVSSVADGTHQEPGVTRLQFSDMSVNLGVGDAAHGITAAQVNSLTELYIAYLDRVPDADGMAYWIGQLKGGESLDQIGQSFYDAAVQFGSLTGYSASMTNADFVTLVYHNVLDRTQPDTEGLNYWTNQLASGQASRGTVVAAMLASAHTFKGDPTYGYVADLLDNKIAVGTLFAVSDGLVYNTPSDSISHGMAIVAAVTPSSTAAAVALIGVNDGFSLY